MTANIFAKRMSWKSTLKHVLKPTVQRFETSHFSENNVLGYLWNLNNFHQPMGFSLNRPELTWNSVNSANSWNLRNHWNMNLVKFKDPLLPVPSWHWGRVLVSYTRDSRFEYSNPFFHHIILSLKSVKTFRECLIKSVRLLQRWYFRWKYLKTLLSFYFWFIVLWNLEYDQVSLKDFMGHWLYKCITTQCHWSQFNWANRLTIQ